MRKDCLSAVQIFHEKHSLGIFGLNCLPALQTEESSTGNDAMLDVAKAPDWVNANIAAFGGDPNHITISGFSAGGRDVMMLVCPCLPESFRACLVSRSVRAARLDTKQALRKQSRVQEA